MNKTCRTCGKEFSVKPSHYDKSTYCSKSCMAEDYRVRLRGADNPNYRDLDPIICQACGKPFYSYAKNRKFCSWACAGKRQENLDQLYRAALKPNRKKRRSIGGRRCTCRTCGKEFIHKGRRQYCPDCSRSKRSIRTCVVCGEPFRHRSFKRTCSTECLSRWKSITQEGEKSHLWQGGKTEETARTRNSAAYVEWRNAVYRRDGFKCQMCGEIGGRLAAHHIVPISREMAGALDIGNGITLCWSCHGKTVGREEQYEAQLLDALMLESHA